MKKLQYLLGILLLTSTMVYCGDGNNDTTASDTDNTTSDTDITGGDNDTGGDSDAVSDDDIDGDGYTNEYEQGLFNPSSNPYKFNPQIADLPKVKIQLISPPKITLDMESSITTSTEITTGNTTETATTLTTSETTTNTTSIETSLSHKWKKSNALLFGGVISNFMNNTGGQSYTKTTTTAEEESFSWSEEQSNENRQAYNESLSISSEEGFTYHSGKLLMTVKVVNSGDIAFTLDNLILSATKIDPYDEDIAIPIGNLDLDTNQSSFPATTIAPGNEITNLVFIKDDLDLTTANELLRSTNGLVIAPSLYELLNADGVAFAHNMTEVKAKTATIIIDYGPTIEKTPKTYFVSTKGDGSLEVSLDTILSDILQISYTDNNGLTELDGVTEEFTSTGSKNWNVVHYYYEGGEPAVTAYTRLDGAYSGFSELMIAAGDVVHFFYLDDADGDQLGARTEAIFGTSPLLPDTDADGLTDSDEVFGIAIEDLTYDERELYTNPVEVDTDGDGINDFTEVTNGTDPISHFPMRSNLSNTSTVGYLDKINDMIPTLDGGVLIAGMSDYHKHAVDPLYYGNWEIQKFNADGTEDTAWRDTISGIAGYYTTANAIALGENGSVYAVGMIAGACNIAYEANWYVTKYTGPSTEASSGWQKEIDFTPNGGSYICLSDHANDVVVDNIGNVYVGGYTTTNQASPNTDWTIKKYTPDGIEITTGWNIQDIDNTGDEEVRKLAIDSDNNLYAVGHVENQVGGSSQRDIHIVKYNASGTVINSTTLEFYADGNDYVNAISIYGNRLFIAGETSNDRWVLKAVMLSDLSEDTNWYKTNASQVDTARVGAMNIDTSGRVYLAIDMETTQPPVRWQLKRYNSDATEDTDWSRYVVADSLGQSNHYTRSIAIHPDGNLYIGGYVNLLSYGLTSSDWYIRKYYIE